MKRLRSSDDLDYYGDKNICKDSTSNRSSSSSHRSGFYSSKSGDAPRKVLLTSYSSRYDRDRTVDDDVRNGLRIPRKRSDYDLECYDSRKGLGLGFGPDRHGERKGHGVDFAERDANGGNRGFTHRSDGFSGPKKEFPKGFHAERDRSRREGRWWRWGRSGRRRSRWWCCYRSASARSAVAVSVP